MIEPRTVATTAMAVRRSNHSARYSVNGVFYCFINTFRPSMGKVSAWYASETLEVCIAV